MQYKVHSIDSRPHRPSLMGTAYGVLCAFHSPLPMAESQGALCQKRGAIKRRDEKRRLQIESCKMSIANWGLDGAIIRIVESGGT